MQWWDRWLRGRLGLGLALTGTVAVPVFGVILLRFLFAGIPVDLAATVVTPVVISPVVSQPTSTRAAQVPTVLPRITQTATLIPTLAPSPTLTPVLVRTVNAALGLNVRTEPTVQAPVVRILPFETEVKLTGDQQMSEGLLWVKVEPAGWVQARYLDL